MLLSLAHVYYACATVFLVWNMYNVLPQGLVSLMAAVQCYCFHILLWCTTSTFSIRDTYANMASAILMINIPMAASTCYNLLPLKESSCLHVLRDHTTIRHMNQ